VLWAELLTALHLSEGTFGTAQLVSPLMATLVLVRYAALVGRVPPKVLAVLGLSLAGGALVLLAWITTLWGLLGSLALLGTGTGLLDGAMSQAAIDWERATR
jgi:MFS family permease